MIQDIIVYIIIAVALGGAVYYGARKLKVLKKNKSYSACTECPLKNNCSKPLVNREDCQENLQE